MIKIAAIGIVTVLLAVIFKNGKSEYGVYIAIAGSVLLLFLSASKLSGIVDIISSFNNYITINQTCLMLTGWEEQR